MALCRFLFSAEQRQPLPHGARFRHTEEQRGEDIDPYKHGAVKDEADDGRRTGERDQPLQCARSRTCGEQRAEQQGQHAA